MNELAERLKERTMVFALQVMRLCGTFPPSWEARFVADQLFRAGARTAANYSASCRARSRRDFISKIGLVVEESDESVFWLKFAGRSGLNTSTEQEALLSEGRELLAIFMQSAKTASMNLRGNRQ
jgi:four helix bundle protein